MTTFANRIKAMNSMYKLPIHETPSLPTHPIDRLNKFKKTLLDEVHEIDDISNINDPVDQIVAIADLLGDVIVYCRSEALKYGIPLEDVLNIIMDSNESKLDTDGKPIYNSEGKFLKGPDYWKPEPKIKELILSMGGVSSGNWE